MDAFEPAWVDFEPTQSASLGGYSAESGEKRTHDGWKAVVVNKASTWHRMNAHTGRGRATRTIPFCDKFPWRPILLLRILSLGDLKTIEQRDFGKVHDECEDRCPYERSPHDGYWQRSHRDSASGQCCGYEKIRR